MSGTSTVEFHIKAKAGAQNAFTLEVFRRGSSQPLGNTTFDYDLSFITDYDVSNLDSGNVEPGIRFEKLVSFGRNLYDRLFTKEIGDLWGKFKGAREFVTATGPAWPNPCIRWAGFITNKRNIPKPLKIT